MTRPTKIIGLLGGMSWESTAIYYRLLNEFAHQRLGKHHNARSILFTLDFEDLLGWATAGEWDKIGAMLAEAAVKVEAAGAEFMVITANTAHVIADQVAARLRIPLLHIADPTGEAIKRAGLKRVGLLGTRFTMEMDFLQARLRERHGLDVLVPEADDRAALHAIIVNELTQGNVLAASRHKAIEMSRRLESRGAQGLIIGCTELPLLMEADAYPLPAFDTTALHAEAAVALSLGE